MAQCSAGYGFYASRERWEFVPPHPFFYIYIFIIYLIHFIRSDIYDWRDGRAVVSHWPVSKTHTSHKDLSARHWLRV